MELVKARQKVSQSIEEFSEKEYELDKRTLGIEELKTVYATLIQQREQAQTAVDKKEYLVQARLLEEATVPFKPSKPNKKLYGALGLMLGLVFAFGIAFFIEYFDHSVYTVEDAQVCLNVPVLAVIQDVNVKPTKIH